MNDTASTPPVGPDAVRRALTLPNGQWTLSLAPAQGWGNPAVLAARSALALLFAVLMAYLARLLFQLKAHERGLAQEVAQRTSEIQATQQQLRMARAMGYGEDDICGSIRALEEIASCKVRDAEGKSDS